MMRLLVGFVVMLMTMTNAHANNPSCQAGTGTSDSISVNGTPSLNNGLQVECYDEWPLTGTATEGAYNLRPDQPNPNSGVTGFQYWQLTAHIAGYSGDGLMHTYSLNGPSGTWDCGAAAGTLNTFYPNIHTNTTMFNNYSQTAYPPGELGHYSSPGPNKPTCSSSVGPCNYWSQWEVVQQGRNGTYGNLGTAESSQYAYERADIGFDKDFGAEDASTSNLIGADDSNNTVQTDFLCGTSTASGATAMNFHGDTVAPAADMLPMVFRLPLGSFPYTPEDEPAELYCATAFGDATVSSSTWSPNWTKDSSGAYPVQVDAAFLTDCCGASDEFQNQFKADIYITHHAGTKGWPDCVIEYDARLNPCPGNVCPCTSTTCS